MVRHGCANVEVSTMDEPVFFKGRFVSYPRSLPPPVALNSICLRLDRNLPFMLLGRRFFSIFEYPITTRPLVKVRTTLKHLNFIFSNGDKIRGEVEHRNQF